MGWEAPRVGHRDAATSFEREEGKRTSRTSVSVGAGENRRHRGPASVPTITREQFKRSGKAAKPRSRAKRNAISKKRQRSHFRAAGVFPFLFGVGNVRNAAMPPARKRAPHKRGAKRRAARNGHAQRARPAQARCARKKGKARKRKKGDQLYEVKG